MKFSHRKWVSLLAAVCVLFTQLAVSAYACPMQFSALLSETSTTESNVADCEDMNMDMAQPGLCQHHCKNEQQNISDIPLDLAPLTFASMRIVDWLEPQSTTLLALDDYASMPSLHHATAPPPAIQHCCFRI